MDAQLKSMRSLRREESVRLDWIGNRGERGKGIELDFLARVTWYILSVLIVDLSAFFLYSLCP